MIRAKKGPNVVTLPGGDRVRVARRQTVAGGPVELVSVGLDAPDPDQRIPYTITNPPPEALPREPVPGAFVEIEFGRTEPEATIRDVCRELADLLVEKNRSYGNSALEPLAVMSRLTARERLAVRIDDKLSRIARGHEYPGDDTLRDLAGYLVLALVERKMAEATQ